MPNDRDLFAEEDSMVSMSFGDHIEDLRKHLFLAVIGLFAGVILTFIPPLDLGKRVMSRMEQPARQALDEFYSEQAEQRAAKANSIQQMRPMVLEVNGEDLARALRALVPADVAQKLPEPETLKAKSFRLHSQVPVADQIRSVVQDMPPKNALISLAPMETVIIYFTVCMITGLVLSSPWVFYQIWAFIAAGLYRHERQSVTRFMPVSLGLFLAGVLLCYFYVLPVTLGFLLKFNVWLGIEPTLRISEWMGFATIMPLLFGGCFQTPLVMLLLERLGILSVDDFRAKRKIAILVIFFLAAVLTPTPEIGTMTLLAVPMLALYELGILIMSRRPRTEATAAA